MIDPNKEIEAFAIATIKRAARKAWRMSRGGVDIGDVEGNLWLRIAPLMDDPDRWNEAYLTTAIWFAAYDAHTKTIEPVLMSEDVRDHASDYIDLYNLIDNISNPSIREVCRLYARGDSAQSIADRLGICRKSVHNKITNAKRLIIKSIDRMSDADKCALGGG